MLDITTPFHHKFSSLAIAFLQFPAMTVKRKRGGQASPLRNTFVGCLMQRPFVKLMLETYFSGALHARKMVGCVTVWVQMSRRSSWSTHSRRAPSRPIIKPHEHRPGQDVVVAGTLFSVR